MKGKENQKTVTVSFKPFPTGAETDDVILNFIDNRNKQSSIAVVGVGIIGAKIVAAGLLALQPGVGRGQRAVEHALDLKGILHSPFMRKDLSSMAIRGRSSFWMRSSSAMISRIFFSSLSGPISRSQ